MAVMAFHQSAGFVVFRRENARILYLLINSSMDRKNWGFPKGHIEGGEQHFETAKRETEEETGLSDLTFYPKFKASTTYFFYEGKQKVMKRVAYYLAETKQSKVILSSEHVAYTWAVFDEVMRTIPYPDLRKILKKADDFLHKVKQESISSAEKKS